MEQGPEPLYGSIETISTDAATGLSRERATIPIPRGAPPGAWVLRLFARDQQFNDTDLSVPITVVDTNPVTAHPASIWCSSP